MSHIGMSHVTHMNESCHTYEWLLIHNNENCHTYKSVMSHMWMSHVTHINGSCHTYEWVMSYEWLRSGHTYKWAIAHMWMSHVPHMDESCHTYEWVISHIWMIHFTHRGWRRPIGCLIVIGHFLQKSPIISSSFAKNNLQLMSNIERVE